VEPGPPADRTLPPLFTEVFRRTLDVDSVHAAADTTLEILDRVTGATWCAIWLFDDVTDTWFISHSRGLSGEAAELRFARGSAIPCLVGERGVPRRLDALDADSFQRSHEVHFRMRSALYVPMTMHSRPVGVIALYSDQPAHFTEEDEQQLTLVARHLGLLVTALGVLSQRSHVDQLVARERVARDLHDGMLQNLSSVQLYVYGCRDAIASGDLIEASALLEVLSVTVVEAISEVRSAIAALRSVTVMQTLDSMLRRMRRRLEAAGLTVELPPDTADLSPRVSDLLASVAREASNNVMKHSDATHVSFALDRHDGELVLECRDDGVGVASTAEDPADGLGLRLLGEAAEALGGRVEFESPGGAGFVLRCRVPVEAE
jgi:signal transduction histidine kinase